ncbi:MAG: hypothetical protein JRJ79_06240 [Deltaproteobacteria bacterium]|nr:hypothetical protein [Deltaproteobacteria bacterium]
MNKEKTGKWFVTFTVAALLILFTGVLQASTSSELGPEIENTVSFRGDLPSPIDSGSDSNLIGRNTTLEQLCSCGHGHDGHKHDRDHDNDCDHDHDCDNYDGCNHNHGHDKDHKNDNDKKENEG